MITGYNTDVEFAGVTYHVQTEDKGLSKPVILSLIYDRGTVLASKRVPYNDLLDGIFNKKELEARLQRQHSLICAAVQAGRIEDLKRMGQTGSNEIKISVTNGAPASVRPASPPSRRIETVAPAVRNPAADAGKPIPQPIESTPDFERPGKNDSPLASLIEYEEDVIILPDDAVEAASELYGLERPVHNKLSLEFLGDGKFRGGERRTLGFIVCRGSVRKVVNGAQLIVKILGSNFRPLIFHSKTDINGIARINLHLPNFSSGRAAILVRAISEGDEIELRRTILHG